MLMLVIVGFRNFIIFDYYIMGFGRKIQSGFQNAGRKLKNDAQLVGKKVTTTARGVLQDAREDHLGRKINNSIQVGNKAIQTLAPLEKIQLIGTGIKVLTGVSGASANISQFSQDQINRKRNAIKNASDANANVSQLSFNQIHRKPHGLQNGIERPTVMPRWEPQAEMFV